MQRIFVLSRRSLFTTGVASLLSQEPGLEIVGQEPEGAAALEHMLALQPDVVILVTDDLREDPWAAAMRLWRTGIKSKVIVLNSRDNTLWVWHGEQQTVAEVADLVAAIEHPFRPSDSPALKRDPVTATVGGCDDKVTKPINDL